MHLSLLEKNALYRTTQTLWALYMNTAAFISYNNFVQMSGMLVQASHGLSLSAELVECSLALHLK